MRRDQGLLPARNRANNLGRKECRSSALSGNPPPNHWPVSYARISGVSPAKCSSASGGRLKHLARGNMPTGLVRPLTSRHLAPDPWRKPGWFAGDTARARTHSPFPPRSAATGCPVRPRFADRHRRPALPAGASHRSPHPTHRLRGRPARLTGRTLRPHRVLRGRRALRRHPARARTRRRVTRRSAPRHRRPPTVARVSEAHPGSPSAPHELQRYPGCGLWPYPGYDAGRTLRPHLLERRDGSDG